MRNQPIRNVRGFAILSVVAWILAALSIWLAGASWLGDRNDPPPSKSRRPAEERTLRLALDTTAAQNAALRTELDRVLSSTRFGADGADPAAGTEAASAASEPTDAERVELGARIGDTVARAARMGDAESNKQAARALMDAFRKGPAGFPALHDAYLAAEDPKARGIMLPTLLFIGQANARDFLIEQVQSETDPDLKKTLLEQSVRYASPEHVERLKDTYLDTLRSSDDPELRAWALRGLRYGKGEDVERTLLSALEDPNDDLRIAAIANLAARPKMHGKIRELASRESGLVREIAECSLLVNGGR